MRALYYGDNLQVLRDSIVGAAGEIRVIHVCGRSHSGHNRKSVTATRTSAYWGKAVVIGCAAEPPLLAMCGRLPVGKGFLDGDAELVGAAMCPAC